MYRLVAHHPRTPRLARWLLGLAIGYVLMPFDLIPDFIPVLGQLDDLIIVPGLIYWALSLIPDDIVRQCREQQQCREQENRQTIMSQQHGKAT